MRHAAILSTGRYVPGPPVSNQQLEAELGEPFHDWLVQHVGIASRHFMAPHEATSDLCLPAARQALERAGLSPEDLDLVVVAGDTPDQPSPGTSSVLQHKLGARNAGTYDVNAACASWVTAVDLAAKTLQADDAYRHILVVGAYGMSRFLDRTDKKTMNLFADGAGAVVLGAGERPGFLGAKLLAHGEYHDALGIYGGGTARPSTPENVARYGPPTVRFVRRFPATFNTERWPMLLRELLGRHGLGPGDVGQYVFTQLNLRTIEATMAALGQPMSRTHWTMDRWGYTGSACIPMTLDDAVQAGKIRRGDLVALCASGGGLAMACALFRWTA